jgi:hypothetical protein
MKKRIIITVIIALISTEFVLARNDILDEIRFDGDYGEWGHWAFCPMESYAAGYYLKSEPYQNGGDDTAINGIGLLCLNKNRVELGRRLSSIGHYGYWGGAVKCPSYIFEAHITYTTPQGSGDDFGIINVRFRCHDGTFLSAPGPNIPTGWGPNIPPYFRDQILTIKCPTKFINGQYVKTSICGIQTRVEGPQGEGDDTGLNGIRFKCCASP